MAVPDRFSNSIKLINLTTKAIVESINCFRCTGGSIDLVNDGYIIGQDRYGFAELTFLHSNWSINSMIQPIVLPVDPSGSSDYQSLISNPVTDYDGRIYVLFERQARGQRGYRTTGKLIVFNATTQTQIMSSDFSNPSGGMSSNDFSGISQLDLGATLTLDPFTQSIVVTTVDSGQVFRTKSFINPSSDSQWSSSSSGVFVSSSTASSVASSSSAMSSSVPLSSSSDFLSTSTHSNIVLSSSTSLSSSSLADSSTTRFVDPLDNSVSSRLASSKLTIASGVLLCLFITMI